MSSAAAPSPFGKLLRSSKFASYDPLIKQVYTTYGGHAYRGNWGIKRPLPNRRRTGFITIRVIDSKEQQTEWNSAESSARWIRRWDETGKKLQVAEQNEMMNSWQSKNAKWFPDSEFSRNSYSSSEQDLSHLVNRELSTMPPMSSKQFERYLERIRSIRPSFKQYLEKEELKNQVPQPGRQRAIKAFGSGEVDMYSSAQTATDLFSTKFRKQMIGSKIVSLDSSISIGSEPHIYAGLEPTVLSPLQIRYLYGPSQGRIVAQNLPAENRSTLRDTSRRVDYITVSGIVGEVSPPRKDIQHIDNFRIARIELVQPPDIVGRQAGKATDTKFQSVKIFPTYGESNLSNPYPLGSRDYVGKQPSDPGEAKHAPLAMKAMAQDGKNKTAKTRPQSVTGQSFNAKLFGSVDGVIAQYPDPVKY